MGRDGGAASAAAAAAATSASWGGGRLWRNGVQRRCGVRWRHSSGGLRRYSGVKQRCRALRKRGVQWRRVGVAYDGIAA